MILIKRVGFLSLLLLLSFCNKTPASHKTDYERFLEDKTLADRRELNVAVKHQCTHSSKDERYVLDASSSDEEWNEVALLPYASVCTYTPSYNVTMNVSSFDENKDRTEVAFFADSDEKLVDSIKGMGKIFSGKGMRPVIPHYDTVYRAVISFKEEGKTKLSYVLLPKFRLGKR